VEQDHDAEVALAHLAAAALDRPSRVAAREGELVQALGANQP
jgi:hypothetical protein